MSWHTPTVCPKCPVPPLVKPCAQVTDNKDGVALIEQDTSPQCYGEQGEFETRPESYNIVLIMTTKYIVDPLKTLMRNMVNEQVTNRAATSVDTISDLAAASGTKTQAVRPWDLCLCSVWH